MRPESRPVTVPDWLLTMPKVELHVHLEGTVGPDTLWALARKHRIDLGVADLEGVAGLYEYRDFTHFIETFTRLSDTLRTAADLALAVEAYGAELARQHVRYAELHFNPEPHQRKRGIAMDDALAHTPLSRDSATPTSRSRRAIAGSHRGRPSP